MVHMQSWLNKVDEIAAEGPSYKLGHDGSDGTCDCIGAIRRAGRVERHPRQQLGGEKRHGYTSGRDRPGRPAGRAGGVQGVRDGALVLTLADGQEFISRPPAAPTFSVVDEMLQITYEEEVVPT